MATFTKRRRSDGGVTWLATVRVRGYPTRCKSFRSRTEADTWAARTESAAHGRTLALGKQITLEMLLDEAEPRLRGATAAALKYWRRELGMMRVRDITPSLIAKHRDRLIGALTGGHRAKRKKPRTHHVLRLRWMVPQAARVRADA